MNHTVVVSKRTVFFLTRNILNLAVFLEVTPLVVDFLAMAKKASESLIGTIQKLNVDPDFRDYYINR